MRSFENTFSPLFLRSFTWLLIVLCCGGLFASSVHAQKVDGEESKPALQEGAWALQFQVTENFTLGSFQGTMISAKKQLSSRRAFRLGVSVGGRYESTDEEVNGEEEPFSRSRNRQSIILSTQYLGYTPMRNAVSVYYGAGPKLGFERDEDVSERDEEPFVKNVDTSTRFRIGLGGALGVEWFVRSNISLTAEYNASLDYSRLTRVSRIERPSSEDSEEMTQTQMRLYSGGVRFGISVYL